MPTGPNPILASDNTHIGVTNFADSGGSTAPPIQAISGIPCTTADGTATGQIVVAVRSVGGGSAGASQVQGTAANDAVAVGNPVYVGGLAVTGSSYAPAYTAGDAAALAVDRTSGGLLTHNRSLTAATDTVRDIPVIQATTYGTTNFRSLTVNSTAQSIKASSGNLYSWNIINGHSAVIYVKFYDIAAGSVNPASSVPIMTVSVSASGGQVHTRTTNLPKFFGTAISVRCVTDFGDTGTTAPATLPIIECEYN